MRGNCEGSKGEYKVYPGTQPTAGLMCSDPGVSWTLQASGAPASSLWGGYGNLWVYVRGKGFQIVQSLESLDSQSAAHVPVSPSSGTWCSADSPALPSTNEPRSWSSGLGQAPGILRLKNGLVDPFWFFFPKLPRDPMAQL